MCSNRGAFERSAGSGGANIAVVARRKVRQLEIATELQDLRVPPANRLEALKGHRAGQHIAFESTINPASVFVGQPQGRKTLRLWTITEGGAAMHKLKSVPPGELLSM